MSRLVEAANRAEVTAILIRCGYRVYRPEADVEGEDLVVRRPTGELLGVQLKSRPTVDWPRYGNRGLLLLIPISAPNTLSPRTWCLVPHDELFAEAQARHGAAASWGPGEWSWPTRPNIPAWLRSFLEPFALQPPSPVDP